MMKTDMIDGRTMAAWVLSNLKNENSLNIGYEKRDLGDDQR